MGTEQSYPIGTILKRREPKGDENDTLRVTGGGKALVVTPAEGFGSNFQLDAAVARSEYETDIPEGVYLQQPTYVDPGPTPEQVFGGEESVPGQSAWRKRKSEDPRTEMESAKVDTGVPTVTETVISEGKVEQTVSEPAPAKPAARKGKAKADTKE